MWYAIKLAQVNKIKIETMMHNANIKDYSGSTSSWYLCLLPKQCLGFSPKDYFKWAHKQPSGFQCAHHQTLSFQAHQKPNGFAFLPPNT